MANGTDSCSIDVEDVFGPIVSSSCLRGFDFTLLFEESILTVLPLGLALLCVLFRFHSLWNTEQKVRRSWLFFLKTLAYAVYIALQAVLLALWADPDTPTTRMTLVTVVITIGGFIILFCASYLEHTRSIRPSTSLALYLGLSLLLDLARLRTLFHVIGQYSVARIYVVSFFVKLLIFCFEVTEKRSLLFWQWQDAAPASTSGIYSRALFIWINDLFLKGFQTTLTIDTLTPLEEDLLSASRPTTLIEKWEKADKSAKNAFLWTFMRHYKWGILGSVIPQLIHAALLFTEPFLLQRVLDFTAEPDGPNKRSIANGLTGAYAIVHIGKALASALARHTSNRVSTMFRGSLITFIFTKTLRLSTTGGHEDDAITLMSADIDRIDMSINIIHGIYTSIIEFPLTIWLLYRLLGVSVSAPAAYAILCLVIGIPIAAAAGKAQGPWLEAIEVRLAITSKILGAMKAIRMSGLTNTISSLVTSLRLSEIRSSRQYRIMSMLDLAIYYASANLMPVIGFGMYILLARTNNTETLTEGVAFAALSLFQLQEEPLNNLVSCFEDLQTLATSFNRIQDYLLVEEREDSRVLPPSDDSSDQLSYSSTSMPINHIQEHNSKKNLASAEPAKSTAISVQGVTVQYSPDSIVLKDVALNIARGKTTMIVGPVGCGKSTLLKLLLGEMSMASGYVQTSYFASAFCPQSPWITWGTIQSNILGMSAWDQAWYNTVVRACALSADFDDLAKGDQTETGTRGSRLSGGQQMRVSLARAVYSRNPLIILDDVLSGVDRTTEKKILDQVFSKAGLFKQLKSTVVLATNSAKHLHFADYVVVLNKNGTIADQGTLESVSASSDYVKRLAGQAPSNETNIEAVKDALQEFGILDEDLEPDNARRTGDVTIYWYYMCVVGKWTFTIYLISCATCVSFYMFPSVWLQWWTNANAIHPNDDIGYWLGIYAGLAFVAVITTSASDWVLNLVLIPNTSRKFHDLLLRTTMRAKISFLTSTAVGHTTNRFSQDLELVDNGLPHTLEPTIIDLLIVIISGVLVCVGSGYIAATIPFCIGVVYLIQLVYLRTSRQLRFLDIEANAPLFSQFLEAGRGISSIRAYGWTQEYIERSYDILNASQKPFYLLKSIQQWLSLVLDLMVAGLAIVLVAIATNIPSGTTNFLGVALFSVIDFSSTLQGLVTQWTKLETVIGAIARIRSYVESTEPEDSDDRETEPVGDWPKEGAVVFKNVSASYQQSLGSVLKNINISIQPGEKVAICGRTGSGKSSLVSTLLCMLELNEGSIIIDGVDISTILQQEVRERLNTLPQEPFFLASNVRENVDPLHVSSDASIIDALQAVQLWDVIEARGGLDAEITEKLLSHGEQQLFCLARAIVRPSKIIIMDEATSSIDSDTDGVLQRVIRNKFGDCTIIAIAHKLQTILDFDRVLLLDQGRVIENGNPQELLATPNSLFKSLYESME